MKYGRFSEDGREFIITRVDIPRPWINYLSNNRYCALISHTGGGYSFFESSGFDRILREYPGETLLQDRPGRFIYLRDSETGQYWSMNGQPMANHVAAASYECRHGQGYTKVSTTQNGIEGSITYFVPLHDSCELWMVRLSNTGEKKRSLSFFTYVEWCLGNYAFDLIERNFANLFNEVIFENNIIMATKRFWNLPVPRRRARDRLFSLNTNLAWDKFAFLSGNFDVHGFDCLKEQFTGMYNTWQNPAVVVEGRCKNSLGDGEDAVGVLQHNFELEPGEERNFVVVLGVVFEKKDADSLVRKFDTWEKAQIELERLKRYWDRYIDIVRVDTPDKDFNLQVNVWNKYQGWVIARWSRMDSYYIGGGSILGFRDTCQDILNILPTDLRWAKERTILVIEHQFQDGSCLHNWDPRTNLSTRTGHSDDPLWLVLTIVNYLKESGDWSFLNELVKYYDAPPGTVYAHMLKALDYSLSMRSSELAGFGISLMGAADWNDGLDQVGREGIGESVMTTEHLCWMLLEAGEICKRMGDQEIAERYLGEYERMKEKLNFLCWDGKWYIRATNDKGEILGSNRNEEGKIYLNSQSWAVMSKVAQGERALQCLDSAKEHLDTQYGPLLLAPAYREPNPDIGIITRFAPGTKENGTIFNHAVCWLIIAECMMGRGDRAYEYFKKTSFIERSKEPDVYKAEPYVYPEYVYGPDSVAFGQGSFTWTTGTAAWMWRACLDWIVGARPELDGLRVDPCIPSGWREFKVRRPFRGSTYNITVKNPKGVHKGVKELLVDGKPVEGNLLPVFGDGQIHNVEAVMG